MSQPLTVLVVGASRGLGLALADQWCRRGWRVIATTRSHSEALEGLARRHPGSLAIETVDTANADSVTALRKRLDGRRLDVLFINAASPGPSRRRPPASMSRTSWT